MDRGCKALLEHYGIRHQLLKAIAEAGEFTQAAAEYLLGNGHQAGTEASLLSEVADLKVLIRQIELHFGEDRVNSIVPVKIHRAIVGLERA